MSLLLLFNGGETVDPGPVVEADALPEGSSRPFLAWGNLIDASLITGGDWVSTLPLANLKNRTLARVARSNGLATSATQFDIDLGPNKMWAVLALQAHNLSLSARWRIIASVNPDYSSPSYETEWTSVWSRISDETDPEWGRTNWWEGTYSEEDRQGYLWTVDHQPPAARSERYVRVQFDDPFNRDSFVQIGRPFIAANGWTPSRGISVGATLGWEDESDIQQAYGGAEFFNEQPRYRVARLTFDGLGDNEAYGRAFEMIRQVGKTGEVFFKWNGSDTRHAIRRTFVGRLRQLSPIEHPYPMHDSVALEIKENQ